MAGPLAAKGTFTKSTGGAPASQAVTGIGFQPKALILWATAQTSFGVTTGYQFAYGITDGTDDYAVCATSEDAQGTADCDRRQAIKTLTILDFTQTVLAECDLTSFDSDGFTLNWTTNNAVAYQIHYFALGGSDLTDVKHDTFTTLTSTGNRAITGTGFQPDCVLFFASTSLSLPDTTGNTSLSIGMMDKDGNERSMAVISDNGDTTSDSGRTQDTTTPNAIHGLRLSSKTPVPADNYQVRFVSMDADGFTVDFVDAASSSTTIGYLALKGGDYHVGAETSKTSTGTKATTGVGFEVGALLIFSASNVASDAVDAHNRIALGAASAPGTEGCIWAGDTDGLGTTEADMATSESKIIALYDTTSPSSADAEADLDSLDSDGYTLDWTTASASAFEFAYLALGAVAVAAGRRRIVGQIV